VGERKLVRGWRFCVWIPIAFGRIEFHRKAAHVALGIGRAQFAGHG
jgi:hypothetical protein